MRWRDGISYFGWLSIGLHWTAALGILALLFIGNSIQVGGQSQDNYLRLHTSLALTLYPLLWTRIFWRLAQRHPQRLPKQKPFYYAIGKPFHYALLAAMIVMLVTGPLMAWFGAQPLRLWSLTFPSPFPVNLEMFAATRLMHIGAATVLGWGTLLHVTAVFKHTVFDRDGSFKRIMMPVEPREE